MPFHDAQLGDKENEMPPKRKQNAKELQKKLREKDAKMKELEAKLAAIEAAANQNKRGTSPTEQVQVAQKIKKARTKGRRKSTSPEDDDDLLKETKEMIAKAIDDPVFAVIKFSKGDCSRDKLAAYVLMYGKPNHGMTRKERDDWYRQFARFCGAELNRHRSGVQTAIKREMRALYKSKTPHEMISVDDWERCLNRDLDETRRDDCELFEAYYDQIMTKATGTTERWNASHKGYFCLYNGHPPNKKGEFDYCVTPETEAYACLVLKGNWNRWNAQFQTTDKFPNYKQKALHHWPDDDVIEASDAIKARLYREQRGLDELTNLPDGWEADMKLPFEGAIPADKKAKKPNQVSTTLSAILAAVHWLFALLLTLFAHSLTPFCPLFFYRSSFPKC